jgi:hypothetical protein
MASELHVFLTVLCLMNRFEEISFSKEAAVKNISFDVVLSLSFVNGN